MRSTYTKSLDASNEQDALDELALFDRDPAAYETKTAEKSRPPSNIQHYLATWGKFYAGRDIRSGPLQEILQELGRSRRARKNRITALKSFTAYLREQEATLTSKEGRP